MSSKVNLLNYNLQQISSYLQDLNESSYRGQQLLQWIHQKGCLDFSKMHNLGKALRQKLTDLCEFILPTIIRCDSSTDGTIKLLLQLEGGNCIETVYIPEKTRGTICVSSQVGCALNCSFCSTGKQGFNRNLSTAEIISQVWLVARFLETHETAYFNHITNVVMMGMGEPLLNFDNVVCAMDLMMSDFAYGLSKRRVTLSTAGVIPELKRLRAVSPVSLAVSLHAPNDLLRNELVPINKKYPLKELMNVCKNYFKLESRRKITFEYVMLAGINDQPKHAIELVNLLQNIPAKVNLIPFNTFPYSEYKCSPLSTIFEFRERLIAKGINTVIRKTRGEDISAACGQLVGNVNDRTKRNAQWQEKIKKHTFSLNLEEERAENIC